MAAVAPWSAWELRENPWPPEVGGGFLYFDSMSTQKTPQATLEKTLQKTPQGLQGPLRRWVFVACYEGIAIAASSLLFVAIGQGAAASGAMAVVASTIAIVWNVVFNHLFERWEARQRVKGRSILRRAVHAMGFEGGLALVLIPLMAWWFGMGLWEAAVLEAGLLLFFLFYTYVFNWGFDRIFGLPASAQALAG